jgi:hypothetical protein
MALVEIVPRRATHELNVTVGLMREEQDRRTIQDMLASEASLVGIEGIAGKTDRGFGHGALLASDPRCPQWVESGG